VLPRLVRGDGAPSLGKGSPNVERLAINHSARQTRWKGGSPQLGECSSTDEITAS